MTELGIPDRALQVACDVYDAELTRDIGSDDRPVRECAEKQAVRAAAPILVATELRRLADEWIAVARTVTEFSSREYAAIKIATNKLRKRADELDPEGGR